MTPPLFSPYRLDELELANRLVMAPMTRGCWPYCWRSPASRLITALSSEPFEESFEKGGVVRVALGLAAGLTCPTGSLPAAARASTRVLTQGEPLSAPIAEQRLPQRHGPPEHAETSGPRAVDERHARRIGLRRCGPAGS